MFKKSILQKILAILARATIRKYRPIVVGVTGSVGKTSARLAIYAVLKKKFSARTAEKNYNNEIGVALTILGMPHYGRNVFGWLWGLIRANKGIVWRSAYPQVLVLEYAVDRPGDMDYLLSLARPDIAVVTAVGDIPAHVEFFENPEDVAREKGKLAAAAPRTGFVILNHDDYLAYDMKEKTKAPVLTYGLEERAEVRISNYEIRIAKDIDAGDTPAGVSFKIDCKGSTVPMRLSGALGIGAAYAAGAGAAVGIAMGMNMLEVSEALREYAPPSGRMRLIRGIKHSVILDDTYNASPAAVRAALETLREAPGKRKIAVLGDVLEIGEYTEHAHRAIGVLAVQCADMIFCVGARAKFIADEARLRGFDSSHVFIFDDSRSAGRALDPMIRAGDLILVKGSQGMRMEQAVEEIMVHPEDASKLLVRQEAYWKNN